MWPKFLRPGIFDILETIKKVKKKDKCLKVVIYTNNMGPRSWTLTIKKYLERKIKYPIFDKVITAFKTNSKTRCRTTHSKTYSDLFRCTYGSKSKYMFLDDYSPRMLSESSTDFASKTSLESFNKISHNSESGLKYHPKFSKYFDMIKKGVPKGAVKNKMLMDNVDPNILDDTT